MADETTKFPTDLGYGDDDSLSKDEYPDDTPIISGLTNFKDKLTYGDGDYLAHDRYKDIAKIIDTLEIPHKNIRGYAFCA